MPIEIKNHTKNIPEVTGGAKDKLMVSAPNKVDVVGNVQATPAEKLTNQLVTQPNQSSDELDKMARISLEDGLRKFGIKESHIKAALQRVRVTRESLSEVMRSSDYGFVNPETIAKINAYMEGMEYLDPTIIERVNNIEISKWVQIPDFEGFVPVDINKEANTITVAVSERLLINKAQDHFEGYRIIWQIASNKTIQSIYRQFFANTAQKFDAIHEELIQIDFAKDSGAEALNRTINSLIRHACYMGASDIMIHPMRTNTGGVILLKVGGVGELFRFISWEIYAKIVNKFKLDAAHSDSLKTTPLEGKLEFTERDRKEFPEIIDRYAFRVQLTSYAENKDGFISVEMRILDQQSEASDFEQLGMDPTTSEQLTEFSQTSHGLLIVCGPTGSGKTSTLYAWLNLIDPIERWVQSIENPVEYSKGLWMQYQIPKAGSNANTSEVDGAKRIFKSLLRNAPDVILAGEVRDAEITEIVIDLANTGHLAETTMHTNDAALAIGRLKNFKLDMSTLASILLGIFAQRLVQVLCIKCKIPDESNRTADELNHLWLDKYDKKAFTRNPSGCPHCDYRGYRGRRMICELLVVTPEIRGMIESGAAPSAIARKGIRSDSNLRANALKLVAQGITSMEEVSRVTRKE